MTYPSHDKLKAFSNNKLYSIYKSYHLWIVRHGKMISKNGDLSPPPLNWILIIDFWKWIATVCSKSYFPKGLLKWSGLVALRSSDFLYLTELHFLWFSVLRMCFHEMQENEILFFDNSLMRLHWPLSFKMEHFVKKIALREMKRKPS